MMGSGRSVAHVICDVEVDSAARRVASIEVDPNTVRRRKIEAVTMSGQTTIFARGRAKHWG